MLSPAPPPTTENLALDLPPTNESVEDIQPLPKAELTFPSSKSLTSPFSEPGGAADGLAASRIEASTVAL